MKLTLSTVVAALSLFPVISPAESEREHGAHDHGAGSLNIAIEEDSVYIEFDAPWDNLVGFEHAPSTDKQIALVEDALHILQSGNALFEFNGATCEVSRVDIDNTMAHAEDDDEHHDEKTSESDSDDHEESHSAVSTVYEYDCGDTRSLESIGVAVFGIWERFEEVDVQVIGPIGAGSFELSRDNAILDLATVN